MRRLRATPFALMLLLGATLPAHAADPPAASTAAPSESARAKAKSRYEAGVAAYRDGRYRDAIDLFIQADRLAPSPAFSFNVARAYAQAGDVAHALRWYRDYLRRSPNASNEGDVKALVLEYERELAKRGVQQLTVLSTPAAATVVLNGTPVGVTPWTGELQPGSYRLELSLRGFAESTRDVALPRERAIDVSVELTPAAEAAPGVPANAAPARSQPTSTATPTAPPAASQAHSPEKRESKFGPWPWITLGAGGAALGGAVVFELLRDGSQDRARRERTQIGYQDALDQMEGRQTAARVLAGLGGALMVGGGVLVGLEFLPGGTSKRVSLRATPAFAGGPAAFLHGTF